MIPSVVFSCLAVIALISYPERSIAHSVATKHKVPAKHVLDQDVIAFRAHYANINMTVVDGIEFVSENHDNGPEWPVPGNESIEAVKEIASSTERFARGSFPSLVQPISIVNFHKQDGTGKRSFAEFVAQIDQLNNAYSGSEARSGRYGSATDTQIRFKLAGVRYVQNDDYFNYCALPSVMAKTRPRYMMNGAVHLNVYVCWCQNNLGLAWLPYDSWFRQITGENHYALGAIVHHELLPGNSFNKGLWSKGNMLVHEIGHCYGLKHPYQGDCQGSEADSDQINDTPRMSGNPLQTCQSLGARDSCRGNPGRDDLGNYMVATGDSCRSHFTPGQVSFMQNTIRQYKPTLMKQVLPACVATVDSTDSSPDLQPCLDGTVATAANGRKVCRTDPDDNSVWAWACCPSSNSWDQDACRQGQPNFSRRNVVAPRTLSTVDAANNVVATDAPAAEVGTVDTAESIADARTAETKNLRA